MPTNYVFYQHNENIELNVETEQINKTITDNVFHLFSTTLDWSVAA